MSGQGTSLFFDLVTAMVAALVGAFVALKLRQSVVVGYLLAGLIIGPFTPGFTGDAKAVESLAEIGIVFLMFVVGIQFSFRDLVRAGRVALLGAALQVAIMIAAGFAVARLAGWAFLEALFFGAVVSNSSSTVLAKVFGERGQADTGPFRTALAWSSVQDLSTVAIVAVLGAVSTADRSRDVFARTLWQTAAFVGVLVPLALFALPRIFARVSELRNREVFALAAGSVALGMSYLSAQLGVSAALGAFLAGAILGDSHLSHRILGETMPLRDAFSGLFFVSLGMLIDPWFVAHHLPAVLLTAACIVAMKGLLTLAVSRWLGSSWAAAAVIGTGLAQSGEFSLLMARLGRDFGAVSAEGLNAMLSGTALSILLSPHLARVARPLGRWLARRGEGGPGEGAPLAGAAPSGHVIVCGHGRVGQVVTTLLRELDLPFVVIDEDERAIAALRDAGGTTLLGDASRALVVERAGAARARAVVIAIPDPIAARQVLDHARALNADVAIIARTHSAREREWLRSAGVDDAVLGEFELALGLGRRALRVVEVDPAAAEAALDRARRGW